MTTIWHLAEPEYWQAAQESGWYDRSTRGATLDQVGFVHCSSPDQLARVAEAGYADVSGDLLVLEVDRAGLDRAGSPVRYEPGDPDDPASELFPHVYGPIPVTAVVRMIPARIDRGRLHLAPAGSGESAGPVAG
ncbi:DUF952 domain-containing protein [Pseudactinotalea sp. Z1739]|uniref:DUF952 domain-containing protein n=1 Tax=Pseudactinotalea sp. Z1739 TaxID=3413028 RepID=UPI003C7C01A5